MDILYFCLFPSILRLICFDVEDLCDAEFARKDVLENHVVSVHGVRRAGQSWEVQPERKKSETCEECGASFYDKSVFLYPTFQLFHPKATCMIG